MLGRVLLDRNRFIIGLPTVVALVALRLVIGWHFYSEGAKHLAEPGWSSEGFLRQAKGPLAANYQQMIPGYDRWEDRWNKTVHGKPGQISKDEINPEDGSPKQDMTAGRSALDAWVREIKQKWDREIRRGVPVTATARIIPAESDKSALLSITAEIDPGLFIYSITPKDQKSPNPNPSEIRLHPSPEITEVGEFKPTKEPFKVPDPNDINVTKALIHRHQVTWQAPVELKDGAKDVSPRGTLKVQACSDVNNPDPIVIEFGGSAPEPQKILSDEQKQLLQQLVEERKTLLDEWVADHTDALLGHIHDWRRYVGDRDKPYAGDVPFQTGRVAKKRSALAAESAGLINQVKAMDAAFQRDVANVMGPELTRTSEPGIYTVDKVLSYGIWIVGICLVLGLFTRTAAALGAAFLFSVVASQPFWIPDALPTYSQGLEMLALIALATTSVGRWGGLDFFIHNYRRVQEYCCGAQGEKP